MSIPKSITRVLYVFTRSKVFQVLYTVVPLVPIFVIDLKPVRAWPYKSTYNKAVNKTSLSAITSI